MGISDDLIILNDSGATFDEIVGYLDRNHDLANSKV